MLNANEALAITRENRSYVGELKLIESYIKRAAMAGKGRVVLCPFEPYHLKTIEELRHLGYIVISCEDPERRLFSYCIIWEDDREEI